MVKLSYLKFALQTYYSGTQFRQWATKPLNEYIRKGFTLDDNRLKQLDGGDYWKERMARIRDIRASEKELRVLGQIVSGYLDFAEGLIVGRGENKHRTSSLK